jgi:hypothetical protein
MAESRLPPLPRIGVTKLEKLHGAFLRLVRGFEGKELAGDDCYVLGEMIGRFLRGCDSDLVFQTLLQYSGRVLNDRLMDLLGRQFVARLKELRAGVLQPFSAPVRDEWVPMEVFETRACVWQDTKPGIILKLYCLAGHPAGHFLEKKVPERWLAYLAYKIGFTVRTQYDYNPFNFVGLRFWGYLLAQEPPRDFLDFEDWKIDGSMKKHNKTIIAKRMRFDIDEEKRGAICSCAFDYDHYCSECAQSIHTCIAAPSRERTYDGSPDG